MRMTIPAIISGGNDANSQAKQAAELKEALANPDHPRHKEASEFLQAARQHAAKLGATPQNELGR